MSIFRIVLIFLILLSACVDLLAQELVFAKRAGGPSGAVDEIGRGVAVDLEGNVYVTGGMLQGSIFGVGEPNQTTLFINGAFVAKYDVDGDLVWVQQIGASNNGVTGYSVDVDGEGSVYVTGVFFQATTFGLGQLNETTLEGPAQQIFVAKYNTDGLLEWAKGMGGEISNSGRDIVVDHDGMIYITGSYHGTVVFGKSEINETELISTNGEFFIAKFNGDGEFIWVRDGGGPNGDGGVGVDVDLSGNVYIVGNYFNSAVFGKGLVNETTLDDNNVSPFLAKYDSEGGFHWARDIFRNGAGNIAEGIAVDTDGNILFTGSFYGTVVIDEGTPRAVTLTSIDDYEAAVAKFNPDGELVWAKSGLGISIDRSADVSTDQDGNVFVAGYYAEDIEFGFGGRNFESFTSSGLYDIFLSKYSQDGEFIWAISAGGDGSDQVSAITVDFAGNSYVTGTLGNTTVFGQGESGETNLVVDGASDIFVAKFERSFNANPSFALAGSSTFLEDFSGTQELIVIPDVVPMGEENQQVTYSVDPQSSDLISISIDVESGALSFSSIENKFGSQNFTIKADDGQKENYLFSQEVLITIEPVNDAPIIAGQAKQLNVDQGSDIAISFDDLSVIDVDNTYPDGFSLILLDGPDYQVSGNKVSPNVDFAGELSVSVLVDDGMTTSVPFILTIDVLAIVGLQNENLKMNSLNVYPVPIIDQLFLAGGLLESAIEFQLYSSLGSLVQRGQISGGGNSRNIDFSELSSGFYVLYIITNDARYQIKVLKE